MTDIVCLLDAGAALGEGTLWDPVAQRLWWVDIWGKAGDEVSKVMMAKLSKEKVLDRHGIAALLQRLVDAFPSGPVHPAAMDKHHIPRVVRMTRL